MLLASTMWFPDNKPVRFVTRGTGTNRTLAGYDVPYNYSYNFAITARPGFMWVCCVVTIVFPSP